MDLIHDCLSRLGAQGIQRTTEGWECRCPIRGCGSRGRSFRVAYTGKSGRPGEFICHKCERRGDLVTLLMRTHRMDRQTAIAKAQEVAPHFRRQAANKKEWQRPDISEWAPYRSVCPEYLVNKGYDPDWIWHYEIGFDRWSREIVIPTRDRFGDLVGITRRYAADGEIYYHSEFPKGDFVWGLYQALESGETGAYVTEGQTDPLGLSPHVDLPVISTFGSGMTKGQARLLASCFETLIMAYDNDSAGYHGTDRAVPLLREAGCHDLFILDYDEDDPGEMSTVDNPRLDHISYLRWRRLKNRLPKKRKKNYGVARNY